MKKRAFYLAILMSIFLILYPAAAYANSSWHWLTVSPMTVLPFAVILTLFIETVAITKLGQVKDYKKVLLVVGLANTLSFLAPYIERAYRFIPTSGGFSLMAAFNKGPYYMVLMGYLFLTLLVELPVVYLLLRKMSSSKKKLFLGILLSNIVTTLIVAILERIICVGSW